MNGTRKREDKRKKDRGGRGRLARGIRGIRI